MILCKQGNILAVVLANMNSLQTAAALLGTIIITIKSRAQIARVCQIRLLDTGHPLPADKCRLAVDVTSNQNKIPKHFARSLALRNGVYSYTNWWRVINSFI